MSSTLRYDTVARLLHWLVVLLLATQFALGWAMPDVHRDTKPVGLIAAHLMVGTALLAAMVLRVIWRLTHRPPTSDLAPSMRAISEVTHWALYALLIAVPLLGWINASSRAWLVTLLGAVPMPSMSAAGSPFGHEMGEVHGVLAWVLLVFVCAHVAAALLHRFVLRDRVLDRMTLP